MTPDEINRAIAEHVGWAWYAVEKGGWYYRQRGCGYTNRIKEAGRYTKEQAENELVQGEPMRIVQIPCPNYVGDLNAMHEAEKTMDGKRAAMNYAIELKAVICRNAGLNPSGLVGDYRFVCSTAAQRAEAFLRTIGKWRGE